MEFIFLHNYRSDFSQRGLFEKHHIFKGAFDENSLNFDPCVKILIAWKVQKVLLVWIFLQTQIRHSRWLHAWILGSRSLSNNLYWWRRFRLKSEFLWPLYQNFENPENPKWAISFIMRYKLFFLRYYQQKFFQQGLNGQTFSRRGILVLRCFDFVCCVAILILRGSQRIALIFDNSSIFQLMVPHYRWHDFTI